MPPGPLWVAMLMLDEPTLGLAPVLVAKIFETVRTINGDGARALLGDERLKRAYLGL